MLPSIQIQTINEFYDYNAKYHSEGASYFSRQAQQIAVDTIGAISMVGLENFTFHSSGNDMRVNEDNCEFSYSNIALGMTDQCLVPMAVKVSWYRFFAAYSTDFGVN